MSSTTFYYSDGSTSTSTNTTLTTSSYSIPAGYNLIGVDIGTSVTIVGSNCFQNIVTLTSAVFLSTSTCITIQINAFRACTGLTSIIFPASLRTIQGTAFYGSGLTTLTIPSTVTTLGDDCFGNMQITSVTIPSTVTSLGLGIVGGNSKLTSIVFASGRTTVPGYTCNACVKLTSITLPNTIISIDFASFENCTSLQSITLPTNLQTIASRGFQYCASLNSISLPNTLTTLGNVAFTECNSITSLIIPASLANYSGAFFNCKGLITLTFASGCTMVDTGSFRGCSALTTINFPSSLTTIKTNAFYQCTALTSPNFVSGLLTMQQDSFYQCTALITVVIPNTVTTFGGFTNCTNLTTINIPNSVTIIGNRALFQCRKVTSPITFPPNLTYIDILSFYNTIIWNGVITIPSTVTQIGYDAFNACTGITGVILPEGLINLSGFADCPLITSVIIPSTVQTLEYRAFARTGLTSITFPEGLTLIGTEAFSATKLTSITTPSTLTTIQSTAFSSCASLNMVTLNEGLTSLNGFEFCTALTSIYIPSTVTSLGGFYGCTGLSSLTIPFGVTTLTTNAFAFCSSLVNVIIPDSVTSIGNLCFDKCTSLETIKLSNNLTYLGYECFRQSKLTILTIPATIVTIGYYQFGSNSIMTSLIFINTSNLTTIMGPIFSSNPPIHVQVRFLAATSFNSLNTASKQMVNWMITFNGVQMTNISILYGAPCFLEGTKILALIDCQECWVPVESLRPTDPVKTIYNSFVPIDVIGYKDIDNLETDERIENRLYVYPKGKQHPELFEDLVLTGTHSVLVKEITQEEREKITEVLGQVYVTDKHYRLPACVDKRSEPYQKGGKHRIYHFALENTDYYMNYGVYANGMLVESSSRRYIHEIANMTLFYAE